MAMKGIEYGACFLLFLSTIINSNQESYSSRGDSPGLSPGLSTGSSTKLLTVIPSNGIRLQDEQLGVDT